MSRFDDAPIRLAARFVPLCRSGDALLIASEDGARREADRVVADVIESLVYCSTLAELEQSLHGSHSPEEIHRALEDLSARGLLERSLELDGCQAAFWDSVGCRPPSASVAFQPLCEGGRELIQYALQSSGLALSQDASFSLVTTDDYLRPELSRINLRPEPWLLAKPVGHTIWIGPLFVPGQTACWSCMNLWMKAQRHEQLAFYGWTGDKFPPQPSIAALPATIGLAAGMIATAVAVWAASGRHEELESAIISLDTRTLRQHRSIVRRHPDCKRCDSPLEAGRLEPLHSFVSPLTSIVSAIETTDKPACGFFHALATFAPPLPDPGIRRLLGAQHSVGKGLTAYEAETCAIAEALERYSAIFRGREARKRARFEQLNAISPRDILLFSDAQFADRENWNATHGEVQWVPEPFDPEQEIEWTEARSLVSDEIKHVPSALCYMSYDFQGARQFCSSDTNGCAAAPSLTEAMLAAVLELIERDGVAIWWYNRLSRPALDLASLGDSRIIAARDAFRERGRKLYVLDLTTDVKVPTFAAIAPKLDGSQPCFGAAANYSPRVAAFKAISEASQVCFWASLGNGSKELLDWLHATSIKDHPYLQEHDRIVVPRERAVTPSTALHECVQRLQEVGIEPFYVNLTRAEVGLPVVRVIAPGLRHFWGRLAPGRLFDVPVHEGWLPRPYSEDEMNPVPCMI